MNAEHYMTPPSFQLAHEEKDTGLYYEQGRIAAGIVLGLYLIYRIFVFYDFPILPLPEIVWNCFVYIMPSSLVFALEKSPRETPDTRSLAQDTTSSTEHAHKSEVLRNVLRLDKSPLRLRRESKPGNPPGLGNWDNSCYQNSVIQALASLRSLDSFLVNDPHGIDSSKDATTASTLYQTVQRLNSGSGSYIWTPPKLKSMSSWQQQDAQEYFSKVVEAIEKDVVAAKNERTRKIQTSLLDSVHPNCSEKLQNPDEKDFPSLPEHPMEGLLAQRVGCTRCGYTEGLSLIPFNCVTIPLGRNWEYYLEDCLDEYTSLESIEGVECAKCTLLKTRIQLRQLSESFVSSSETDTNDSKEEDGDEGDATGTAEHRNEAYQKAVEARLEAVTESLKDEDFTEATLAKKCQIPSRLRTTSTKSRQAVIARAPKTLVLHVNRSLFDETTGVQSKNYADVRYPKILDLTPWCIGSKFRVGIGDDGLVTEEWEMAPSKSMIQNNEAFIRPPSSLYELRAVITHYGRHENGHYICYRKVCRPCSTVGDEVPANNALDKFFAETAESWWRFSDEDVSQIDEETVLAQGGVFMLFYERIDPSSVMLQVPASVATHQDLVVNGLNASSLIETSREALETDSTQPMDESDMPGQYVNNPSIAKPPDRSTHGDEISHSATLKLTAISENESLSASQLPEQMRTDRESTDGEMTSSATVQVGLPAMRTAGPEIYRHSEESSPFRPLHMVASM